MQTHGIIHKLPQEALNPIFDYAAKGQCYEKRREWRTAVHWYHRALACLPNLFGMDKKIRPLNIPDGKNVSFKPQHASRIYAALGRVLTALGHRLDSFLAYQAAAALDPENDSATEFLKANSAILEAEAAGTIGMRAAPRPGHPCTQSDLKENITLIMVTHCTQRLKKFEALSPPSSKLVTATYGSLLSVFGEDVGTCPKIMCYDLNPKGSGRDAQYTRSIEAFSRRCGFILQTYQRVGLFNVLNQTIQSVDTPYILFVEHDWMFRGEHIQLPVIIDMMNDDPKINAIRLNKRDNYLNGQDFLMNVDATQRTYPLMRTSSYSNNPSIIRTEKLKKEWLPICEEALQRVSDNLGGSAFGVEEILFKNYVKDIRAHGFQSAHARWGTHVFGRMGDPARVTHLGE